MKTNINTRYLKSSHMSEDLGKGKSKTSKARHRRSAKRSAKMKMKKDLGI